MRSQILTPSFPLGSTPAYWAADDSVIRQVGEPTSVNPDQQRSGTLIPRKKPPLKRPEKRPVPGESEQKPDDHHIDEFA
jgi:hypothetical protein